MIKATQGFDFTFIVKDAAAKMVLFDGLNKIIIDTIETLPTGEMALKADAETTKEWWPRSLFLSGAWK
jgi:hypothetical protein